LGMLGSSPAYCTSLPRDSRTVRSASGFFLALITVKGHNRNIFRKLQVRRRTDTVPRARELALL
jgi:DNA-binding CsgD family transcriptional regulator